MFKLNLAVTLAVCTWLSSCATHAPADKRIENFGAGLPSQHDDIRPEQYETQPWLSEPEHELMDSDNDGVINHRDACEEHDENVEVDTSGCALSYSALRTIDLDIQFDSGSSEIKPQYLETLNKLATLHQTSNEFVVLIEGHTDSTGNRSSNMKLSKARANAVGNALVSEFGLPKEKVLTTGLGPDQPIASNDTAEGRQMNRRMVAHIIQRDRIVSKHYNVWMIELGKANASQTREFSRL